MKENLTQYNSEDASKLNLLLIITITLLNVRIKRILQKCYFMNKYWIYNAINAEMLNAIDITMEICYLQMITKMCFQAIF